MQMPCSHILLAIDLTKEAPDIAQRAMQFVQLNQAKMTVLHVHQRDIESEHIFVDQEKYQENVQQESYQDLQELLSNIDIPKQDFLIKVGNPNDTIIATAGELSCDLIILGSHGKHGIQKILGSTANYVINHAECNVLVVKSKY